MSRYQLFFIWSVKHQLWWKENEAGYTPALNEAGLYTADQAQVIEERSQCAGRFDQISVRVPLSCMTTVSTLTHGSDDACPEVVAGTWTHCKGHKIMRTYA
jgi:hypothetical protein